MLPSTSSTYLSLRCDEPLVRFYTRVLDLSGKDLNRNEHKEEALEWFCSDDQGIMSFYRTCEILKIDPEDTRDYFLQEGLTIKKVRLFTRIVKAHTGYLINTVQ
ncbi:TPA: hypothetical protein HA278_07235 [Candidatus Woesearchaeota archaeon]|nr:hypothetical protein [archaeon]HIJ11826.1 hypothetical protein [Candidatus Woesearchaeota archaeon]